MRARSMARTCFRAFLGCEGRGPTESKHESDGPGGRCLSRGLYNDVLVLRCTYALYVYVIVCTNLSKFRWCSATCCLSCVTTAWMLFFSSPLNRGRYAFIRRCLMLKYSQIVAKHLLLNCGQFSTST